MFSISVSGDSMRPRSAAVSGNTFLMNGAKRSSRASASSTSVRVSGSDFFGSVTFPVGNRERCVTFVLGGWGGTQVGISSIDGADANQNETGSSVRIENGRWYRIRIEVQEQSVRVWLDDRPLVSFNPKGRQLHLRGGDIAQCVPFGFATFATEGRVRACVVERL